MTREEQITDLRARLRTLSGRLHQGLAMKTGGSAAESQYSDTYDQIAKLGGAQRLRKKYRAA